MNNSINIILIKSYSREYNYGVGSFFNNLLEGFKQYKDFVNIYIADASKKYSKLSIQKTGYLNVIQLPFVISPKLFTEENYITGNKGCDLVAKILSDHLPNNKYFILFNGLHEYPFAERLKKHISAKLLHVFHTATKDISMPYDTSISSFLENVDFFVTPSEYCKNYMCSLLNLEYKKVKVIHNGFHPLHNNLYAKETLISLREKYNILPNELVFLYVGRVDYQKGVKYLIEAFISVCNDISNVKLLIIGEGHIDAFLPLCRGYYSKITFVGFVPHEELFQIFEICHVGVIPSLNENCSYVALEMMYFRLPIIATNVGGFPEIIDHENTGILTPCKDEIEYKWRIPDVTALAINMQRLITNVFLQNQLKNNAYKKISTELSAVSMATQYLNLIKTSIE